MNCCCCCPMVSSSSAFDDDDDDDDDDVSLLLSKSVSSSSPLSFFFESATKRILFRRPRCVRPRSKRVVVARVERRTKLFEKVEEDDDDENHGAERTAPPPTRTVKEDVMFSREHYTTLCRLCMSSKFFRRSMQRSLALSSLKARVSRFNSSAERRGRTFPQRYVANANEEQHQRRHHQRRRIRISTQRK